MPANRPDFDAEARELWEECAGGLLPLSDLYAHEHIAAALAAAYQQGQMDAADFLKERGDKENHVVAPGLWFGSGLILHRLTEGVPVAPAGTTEEGR